MHTELDPTRPHKASTPARTRLLPLLGGTVAGPFLLVSSLAQGATRDGFSFADHPPSALSNGDLGWIQTGTFMLTGALIVAAGLALLRSLGGPGSTWGPRLLIVFGVALTTAGVFPMDAAFGFPPGTPPGLPDAVNWHGAVHGVAFPVGFGALLAACFVFARRYGAQGRPTWRWASIVAGPTSLILASVPNVSGPEGQFLPLWIAVVVAFSWCSAVINDARTDHGAGT